MSALSRFLREIVTRLTAFRQAAGRLLNATLGTVSWQPPGWLTRAAARASAAGSRFATEPVQALRRIAIGVAKVVLVLVALVVALVLWANRSRPSYVGYAVTAPGVTDLTVDQPRPEPLQITFEASAALLAAADKEITSGIEMSPRIAGAWRWMGDRTLRFDPAEDWPVGQEYKVALAKQGLLAPAVLLEDYRFTFVTASFDVSVDGAEFYQDPTDPALKKVILRLHFTHPVDTASLAKHVALRLEGGGGLLGRGKSVKFTLSLDRKRLHASVLSEPLTIPKNDAEMVVTVDEGVRSARGGPGASGGRFEERVRVPGLFSLAVTGAELTLVRNERYEPEQVLVLNTSADVNEEQVRSHVRVWVLPVYHPDTKPEDRKRPYDWNDPSKIGPEILRLADSLPLTMIPAERENTSLHSFKYRADPGRYIYLQVAKGVTAFGGYVLGKSWDQTAQVPQFPKEIKILGSGSLLSLSGDRTISVYSRDVPALQVEVGRVLPAQLQHLVTQTGVLFGQPAFTNWNFNESNLTQRFSEVLPIPFEGPGKAHYSPYDLTRYLAGAVPRGLFVITVRGYDPVHKYATGPEDRRLVLVTDLGLVAKRGADGGQDVFVQSLRTGLPVSDAAVDVVGKNGLTILSSPTDAEGHVRFPSLKGFEREQAPVLYAVRRGDDLSFLPMDRYDRELNISRFDVGGVSNAVQADRLSAYLFSDRGVYRPGDEFHIGVIVKPADWSTPIGGIPLEAVITDARGLEVKRSRLRLSPQGFEEIRYATEEASPTGTWTVSLFIVKDNRPGGLLGSTTVQIREFVPDRMKMTTRLSRESVKGWITPDQLSARVTLQNLFSTPAAGRRITATLELTPGFPALPGFEDYRFSDPQRAKETFSEELADVTTDEKGEAEIPLGLERFAGATYRLRIVTQGYEAEGGRAVTAEAGAIVSSLPFLVGFKPDGDLRYLNKGSERSVQFVAVGPEGAGVAASRLRLGRLRRSYVSVLTRQSDGTYQYQSVKREAFLSDAPFSIPRAGATVPIDTGEPGDYALVVADSAGTELARVDYTVAGSANLARSLERNAELELTLDKTDYAPGETIEMQIRAPYTGAGLITIERDRVYTWRWFRATTNSSTQRITLPAGLEGNGYVSVQFVRDVNSDEIFTSPLSFGVAPFSVNLDQRRTAITLDAPALVKPGDQFSIKFRTDQPSRIVVFAVDEGILQVARYRTPDPLGFFFQKRALEVRTTQILDLILPEFQRLMALAAPGGDQEGLIGRNLNPFKRRRDKPVAFWSGVRDAGPGGGSYTFTVPEYFNGTLRVMAVAVTGSSVGAAEEKATVRGDFVLSPNAPLMVAPGDTFEVSVGVANNVIGSGKGASIALDLATTPQLEVLGPAKTALTIDELRESSATFRLRARETLGSADLVFTSRLGAKSGRITTAVSVRPAVPYRTALAVGAVRGGAVNVKVDRDLFRDFRTVEAGISVLPLGLARGLSAYLEKFPYGCTEQLVSQGVPALVFKRRPDFGVNSSRADSTVSRVLDVLRSRQNEEGAYGLWAANTHVNDFVSVYAQHFLLEARERGFPVPPEVLAQGTRYLQQLAASDGQSLGDERTRAYAIYLMARQGLVVTNYATALQRRVEAAYPKEWRGDLTGAYLATTYLLLRQEKLANDLIGSARFGERRPPDFLEYYDDGLIHDAQLLYLLARHFPARVPALRAAAIDAVVGPIQGGSYNSLSSAYAILALDAYAAVAGEAAAGRLSITESLSDNTTHPLALPPGLFPKAAVSERARLVAFGSEADVPAFYLLTQAGFDRAVPAQPESKRLEVNREYLDKNGKAVTSVELGDELEVHLRFRALDGEVPSVALVDLLPGGFEVVEPLAPAEPGPAYGPRANGEPPNGGIASPDGGEGDSEGDYQGEGEGEGEGDGEAAGMATASTPGFRPTFGSALGAWEPEYAEVREDRVNIYATATPDVREFVYRVKATAAGTFVIPPAYGESMYDRSVRAWSGSGRIVVKRPTT